MAVRMTPPEDPSRDMASESALGHSLVSGRARLHFMYENTGCDKRNALFFCHLWLVVDIAVTVDVGRARAFVVKTTKKKKDMGQRQQLPFVLVLSPPMAKGCLCSDPPRGMLYTVPPLCLS